MPSITLPGVLATPRTDNRKTGPVAVTHVAQSTCPTSCPFLGAGCYAEEGHQAFVTRRLNRHHAAARTAARHEIEAIDELPADRPLRAHIVGDVVNRMHARALAGAVSRYVARFRTYPARLQLPWRHFRKLVWLYTHNHAIPRADFGPDISVFRSCETIAQVQAAWADGFAAALVVPEHPGHRVYRYAMYREVGADDSGAFIGVDETLQPLYLRYEHIDVLPCLEQTGLVRDCASCGVCANDTMLRQRRLAIGFAAHARKAGVIRAYLSRMRGRV